MSRSAGLLLSDPVIRALSSPLRPSQAFTAVLYRASFNPNPNNSFLLDHPGRVTLKIEELFFLSSTIESREGRVILRLVS